MRAVRSYSAWEAANTRATGGGPPTDSPETDGIVVTGSLLSLKKCFGIGVTGTAPIGSDSLPLPPPIEFESELRCVVDSVWVCVQCFICSFWQKGTCAKSIRARATRQISARF